MKNLYSFATLEYHGALSTKQGRLVNIKPNNISGGPAKIIS